MCCHQSCHSSAFWCRKTLWSSWEQDVGLRKLLLTLFSHFSHAFFCVKLNVLPCWLLHVGHLPLLVRHIPSFFDHGYRKLIRIHYGMCCASQFNMVIPDDWIHSLCRSWLGKQGCSLIANGWSSYKNNHSVPSDVHCFIRALAGIEKYWRAVCTVSMLSPLPLSCLALLTCRLLLSLFLDAGKQGGFSRW